MDFVILFTAYHLAMLNFIYMHLGDNEVQLRMLFIFQYRFSS